MNGCMYKTAHCNVRCALQPLSSIFSSYTVTVAGGTANRELRKKLDENRGCAGRQKLDQWVDYLRTRGVAVDWPPEPDLQTAIVHTVTC